VDEEQRIYTIPKNFAEPGRAFGNLYARNIIEAIVLTALLYQVEMAFIPFQTTIKIAIVILTCLPLLGIGCVGVRGYSLIEFTLRYIGYRQNRRKLKLRRIMKRLTKADMDRLAKEGRKTNVKKKRKPMIVKKTEEGEESEDQKKNKEELKHLVESVIPQNMRVNKSNQHFVQELLPFKRVEYGLIRTRDGQYVKILEIMPANLNGMNGSDFNAIGQAYEEWLRVAPCRVQIKVITQKKTSFDYIDTIKHYIENENNPDTRKMGLNYIRHIKELTHQGGISRRAFLIFQYEREGMGKEDMETIYSQIYTRVGLANQIFNRMGNKICDAIDGDQDAFVYNVLYELLNRKTAVNEPFANREKRVRSDIAKVKKIDPIFVTTSIAPNDLVAPRGIDFTNPDYVVIEGVYTSYISIEASSLPTEAHLGWTSYFINAGEGIDVDIFTEKMDRDKELTRIERKLTTNQISYNDSQGSSTKRNFITDVLESGFFIKQQMTQGGEDLYYTTILITIMGNTRKELESRKTVLKGLFKQQNIGFVDLRHQMEDCFLSTLPLCNIEKTLFAKNKRNMLTQSVASMYPFTSYEMNDKTGIALGHATNGSIVFLNLFNNAQLNNANMFVVGSPGAGKTYTISIMAIRMRIMQIKTIIIAPFKGYEFKRACNALGGSFIKLSLKSKHCINIMDIMVVETEYSNYDDSDEERNPITEKIENIIAFLELIYPEITNKQRSKLDKAIKNTYAEKGILLDKPKSIYQNGKDGAFKEMPILGDLQEQVAKDPELTDIDNALEPYVNGRLKCFNQHTNVDINNKYTVIDVSELSENLLAVGMFIAITFSSENIEADRTKQKAIIFDEAWRVLKSDTDKSGVVGEYVKKTVKIIRGMGGSAIFATQDLKDLNNNDNAKSIISACHSKLILGLEKSEAELAQRLVGMTDEEVQFVQKAERGFGLLCAGKNRIPLMMKASELEHELITTSRSDLEQIEKRRMAEKLKEKNIAV